MEGKTTRAEGGNKKEQAEPELRRTIPFQELEEEMLGAALDVDYFDILIADSRRRSWFHLGSQSFCWLPGSTDSPGTDSRRILIGRILRQISRPQ